MIYKISYDDLLASKANDFFISESAEILLNYKKDKILNVSWDRINGILYNEDLYLNRLLRHLEALYHHKTDSNFLALYQDLFYLEAFSTSYGRLFWYATAPKIINTLKQRKDVLSQLKLVRTNLRIAELYQQEPIFDIRRHFCNIKEHKETMLFFSINYYLQSFTHFNEVAAEATRISSFYHDGVREMGNKGICYQYINQLNGSRYHYAFLALKPTTHPVAPIARIIDLFSEQSSSACLQNLQEVIDKNIDSQAKRELLNLAYFPYEEKLITSVVDLVSFHNNHYKSQLYQILEYQQIDENEINVMFGNIKTYCSIYLNMNMEVPPIC